MFMFSEQSPPITDRLPCIPRCGRSPGSRFPQGDRRAAWLNRLYSLLPGALSGSFGFS